MPTPNETDPGDQPTRDDSAADLNETDRPSANPAQFHTLLLVEDNPGDARLVEEALGSDCADGLHVVRTGEDALDFVYQRDEYADAPRPDLVLLDWHLPGTDGEEVLRELNGDPDHDHIPVIVLTGSQSEQEVRDAYSANANACINKKAKPEELEATLEAFEKFWLSAARIPRDGAWD